MTGNNCGMGTRRPGLGRIMATMRVYSNHRFSIDLPAGHRFPMPKYQLLRDRVAAECIGLQLAEAEPASDGELALAHTPDYIRAVTDGTLSA